MGPLSRRCRFQGAGLIGGRTGEATLGINENPPRDAASRRVDLQHKDGEKPSPLPGAAAPFSLPV